MLFLEAACKRESKEILEVLFMTTFCFVYVFQLESNKVITSQFIRSF